jgi:hypothetical protein
MILLSVVVVIQATLSITGYAWRSRWSILFCRGLRSGGSLSGPTGWSGLAVRQWRCSDCGSLHDRDVNAARNTLFAGVGTTHEEACHV